MTKKENMVSQRLSFALWCMLCLNSSFFLHAQTFCPSIISVTNTNDDGLGSLREAIDCANSTSGANTIEFALAGTGPHVIYVGETTGEPLVIFDSQTTIDGSSIPGSASEPRLILDGSRGNWDEPVNGLFITADNCTVSTIGIRNFPYNGIDIFQAQAVVIDNNSIYNNGEDRDFYNSVTPSGPYEGSGIRIRGESQFCIVTRNIIGAENSAGLAGNANEYAGILIDNSSTQNFIGRNDDWNARNAIVYNPIGIEINNARACAINRNRFACNEEAIKLVNGANDAIPTPTITVATTDYMEGTASANASVELFLIRPNERTLCPDADCQGFQYLATVTANANGIWQYVSTANLGAFDMLTVTATDAQFNTSPFSACRSIVSASSNFCGSQTITVTNTNDDGDGSLRSAIDCANITAGTNTIEFDIAGNGPHIIYVGTTTGEPLPTLTDDETIIDGGTQAGFGSGFNFSPQIIIDGSQYEWNIPVNGLLLEDANNTEIYALEIRDFTDDGIDIYRSDNCIIGRANRGNVIYDCGEEQDYYDGVSPPGPWNGCAIVLQQGSDDCIVAGNYLGTNYEQTYSPGNEYCGVIVLRSSRNNIIGGNTAQDGNVIANNERGIRMSTGVRGCQILQNSFVCNDLIGIELANGSNQNQASPVISNISATLISGTAPNRDYVEVYLSNVDCLDDACQGTTLLGVTTASNRGQWTLNLGVGALPSSGFVVATATSPTGNTSEFSDCASITTPSCATFTLSASNTESASCEINNGEITLSATGGIPPYRYQVIGSGQTSSTSGTFQNLSAGTYTGIAIDDFNCRTSVSFQIGEAAPLSAIFSNITTATCGNATGSFDITAQGGSSPYTYDIGLGATSNNTFTFLGPETYNITITDNVGCELIESITISDFSNFQVNATSIRNSTCDNDNGSVSLLATGGTSPFFFTMNGTTSTTPFFNNLPAGTYNLLAVDANGCVDETIINIGEQPGLSITTNTQDANCDQTGGAITITPSNGTPPISYDYGNGASQSNVLSNLNAGTYLITATDAANCSVVEAVTVNAMAALDIQLTGNTAASCGLNNGSFGVIVNSGTAPYSFDYGTGSTNNNIFTNVAPGTYTLTVTDAAGCETTENVNITSTPDITAIAANIVPESCSSPGQFSIFASGTFPFSFDIGNGASSNPNFGNLTAGTYNVSITDAVGCMTVVTAIIPDNGSAITANVNTIAATCGDNNGGLTINASNGQAPYTYDIGNGATTSPFINNLAVGGYVLTVTDASGCEVEESFTITQNGTAVVASIGTIQAATCGQTNGALIINPVGGTPPYIFELGGISNSTGFFDNLSGAIYNIEVTDADGCSDVVTATVSSSPTLIFDTNETGANCGQDDGSTTVDIISGTPPFTYDLGNGATTIPTITNLAIGTYTLTVTDNNGCESTKIIDIDGSTTGLSATTGNILDATCGQTNGGFSLIVANGSGNYTYDLGNGAAVSTFPIFSNLASGTYDVLITDTNTDCTTILPVTVNDANSTVNATFTGIQSANCGQSNGAFVINATGGNLPYTYAIPGQNSTTPSFTNLSGGVYNVTITDANNCQSIESITIDESDPLLIAIGNQDNATCNQTNGTFGVIVNSGTPPYTYNIGTGASQNPTFTNLAVATYFLTVTDNAGCTATESVTILPAASNLSANASGILDASCGEDNGSFTINANGGTPPYSYNIGNGTTTNPIFNNLAANVYAVTITDTEGCETISTARVNNSISNLTASINNVNSASCGQQNGGFEIVATGGNPPYSYQIAGQASTINPSFSNLRGGTYNVTITDADGCTSIEVVTVEEDAALTANIINETNTTCGENNASFTVNVSSGTAPFSYNIGNGATNNDTFTNLAAANYVVTITDANNCSTTQSINIQASSGISANVSAMIDASCGQANGGFAITASGGSFPYIFDIGNGAENSPIFNDLSSGVYTILVTDSNGCQTTVNASISDAGSTVAATFNNIETATCGQSNGAFNIIPSGGNPPYNYTFPGQAATTNSTFNNLSGGLYNITITDNDNCQSIEQVNIPESDPVLVSLAAQNEATCGEDNGSFSVNVISGTPPFSYNIGNGSTTNSTFNNLPIGSYTVTVTDANNCSDTQLVTIQGTSGVSANISASNDASCGQTNGSFTVNATGGTPPYSYDIGNGTSNSPMFENLANGIYNIVVTDMIGCQDVISLTINDAGSSVVAIFNNLQAETCGEANGAFSISATGGDAPYTYQVSGQALTSNPNFSNLSGGNYDVTITDNNGCETIEQITIPASTPLVSNITNTADASCGQANGAFDINIVSGTAPYEYIVNGSSFTTPNFTGLNADFYNIVVVDANQCINSMSITINDSGSQIVTDIFSQQNATCGEDNGRFSITSLGGQPPYTYSLNGQVQAGNIFEGLAVGTYTVLVNDANGCETTETITLVNDSPELEVEITANSDASCGQPNGSFTVGVIAGTPPYLYNFNNTLTSTPTFDGLNTGVYNVTVTDSSGCTDVVTTIIAQLGGTGALDVNLANVADANCEQSNGAFSLSVSGGVAPYTYDIGNGATSDSTFDNLNSGTYSVTVTDANGCTGTQDVTIDQLGTTLAASANNEQIATCGQSNGGFGINATGGQPPYNYDIGFGNTPNPVFSNVSGGVYFVTVTDATNCSSVVSVNIDETMPVTAEIVNNTAANCNQDNGAFTVSINSGQAPFNYDIGNGASQNPNFSDLATGSYTVTITDANGCTTTELVNIDQSTTGILAEINNISDADCGQATGSFFVNVTTGTAPFTFNIGNGNTTSPTFDNLASGTYTLNISDANGCTTSESIAIGDTGAISANIINPQDATCGEANASFEVNVNGGTAPFTYDIGLGVNNNPNFSNLNAGNYTLSINDANGCTTTQQITLGSTDAVSVFITDQTDATCNDSNGSVTIGVSSGQAPFSYNIGFGDSADPNFGSLAVGGYTITVTDANGCQTTQTVAIDQDLDALVAEIDNLSDATCGQPNGSFTINVTTGTAPFTYDIGNGISVNPTFNNLASGVYTISISDASGCNSVQQINVGDTGNIMASISTQEDAACGQASGRFEVAVNGGTAPFTYNIGNGGTQNPIFENLAVGTYEISISDANGCFTTESVVIEDSGAVSAFIAVQSPTECNEANGQVTIAVNSGDAPFNYDIGGGNTFNPTFSNLAEGTYTITITDANNCSTTQDVTIERDINSLDTDIANIQNALCGQADGSFMVMVNSGAAPFSYDIGNGATSNPFFNNLLGGTYTLSITDASGCFNEESITIEDAGTVTASLSSSSDADCGQANGSFAVDVSSGTPPFSYNIGNGELTSPVFNDLLAGNYTVTITDANGCQSTQTASIDDGTAVEAFITEQNNATCGEDNGSFTLVANAGAAPFQFDIGTGNSFSPNFSNLADGTYNVTITDANNCQTTQEIIIERDANSLAFNIDNQTDATCGQADASFMVSVNSGNAPFTYDLGNGTTQNPVFDNLPSGNYDLTVTDANACTAIENIIINDSGSSITATTSNTTTATCGQSNASFTINAANGLPPYSYNIGFGDTNDPIFNNVSGGVYFVTITDGNACQSIEEVTINETDPVTTSIVNLENANCGGSNGSVTLDAQTGLAPFTFDIGNGTINTPTFGNLAAGTYIVTITDANGCTDTEMINIDQDLAGLEASISNSTNAACGEDNASFEVNVANGDAPYTFNIGNGNTSDPNFTDLAAGTYNVTISDANGCTTVEAITLDNSDAVTVTIDNINSTLCGDSTGSFTANPSGGTAPFTFDIGNGTTTDVNFSNLVSGTYTLSVTDANGCLATQNITIEDTNNIAANIAEQNNASCNGSNASFTISVTGGAAPFMYDIGNGAGFSPNFAGLSVGTYEVTISDANNCATTQSVTIENEDTILEAEVTNLQIANCGEANGGFYLNMNSGSAPFSFDLGNGNTSDPNFADLAAGNYTVSISDANGCFTTQDVTIEGGTGINAQIANIQNANCGENNGAFSIQTNSGDAPFSFDIGNGNTSDPNFTELLAGNYIVSISDANGCFTTQEVIIEGGTGIDAQIASTQNANCGENNGAFSIQTNSGDAPFSFDIGNGNTSDPNFTDLTAGNYIVSISDANGCFTTQEVIIEGGTGIDAQIASIQNAICGENNGSFSIQTNSGDAPFSFDIGNGNTSDPNFTELAAGNYIVSISDANGCFTTQDVTIEGGGEALVIGIGNLQNASCGNDNGAFIIQPNNGTAPFTYNIGFGNTNDQNFADLAAGVYDISVSDANGCFITESVSIIDEGTSITSSASNITTATCGQSNASFTVDAANGIAPYSYDIGFGMTNDPVFNNVSGGVYFVSITDATGCQTLQEVEVDETTPLTIDIINQENASCNQANASFAVAINTGTAPYSYDIGTGASSDSTFTNLDGGLYTLLVTDANGCTTTENVIIDITTGLEVEIGLQLQASCGQTNGAFSLNVTGGLSPYNYDLGDISTTDPTFENLASGDYEVTIHDASGCFITQAISIAETNNITATLGNLNNTSCGETNGAFTILANGGAPPYSYDYGNGASNTPSFSSLEAGEYNVTISDNNGCFIEQNITIEGSEPLDGSVENLQNDNCGQGIGSFTVLPSGGQAPYTYDIGNGATTINDFDGLTAGIYNLVITDITGCFFIEEIEIGDSGNIDVMLNNLNNPSCIGLGGSFTVEVTGGNAPFTYDIGNGNTSNPNFDNLLSGSYTLSVSDANGCFSMIDVELTANTVDITASITDLINATCNQDNASFTISAAGGQAPYTYDIGNGATTNPSFEDLGFGDYEVSITDVNGCTSTQLVSISSSNVLAVNVDNVLNDACNGGNGSFMLNPQSGTPPYTYDIGNGEQFFGSFGKLAAATYTVTITDANGCSSIQSVTIDGDEDLSIAMTNQIDASCGNSNGSVSVQMQSGRAPFVYNIGNGTQLAPNFNNLAPGNYTVSVRDFSGCTGQIQVSVGDTAAPFVSIYDINTANCETGDGTFSVSVAGGASPYLYNIGNGNTTNPTFEDLNGGTYTVTVTDVNNCQVEAGVTIPVIGDSPQAGFIIDTIGYFVEAVNTSINANEFIWMMGDGTTIEQFNILHDYPANGMYELCLTAINECGEDTFCREVMIIGEAEDFTEIGGEVMTENQVPIGNVVVNCTNVGDVNTQFDGIYAFGSVTMGNSYTIRPSKEDNLLNGISTYDLFLIKNHVLATELIDSPYKLIAADLNNSGSVTAFDEVVLRQLLLGIRTELPGDNDIWRFVDANFEFPDPTNPWATAFPEEIVVDNLNSLIDNANFVGVKTGDINGNAINNGLVNVGGRSSETQWLEATLNANRDEISLNLPDDLLGAQFTLEFDTKDIQIQDITIGDLHDLDESNFNLQQLADGKIAVSWNNYSALPKGGTLLKLQVELGKKADVVNLFQITSSIIRAEAYTQQYETLEIHNLDILQSLEMATPLRVEQNTPNPFSVSTQIPFFLPETTEVTLTLFDTNGRILAEVTSEFETGNNTWEVFREDLSAGVIYYRVATETEAVTKKMVITH